MVNIENLKKNVRTLLVFIFGGIMAALPLSLIIYYVELPKLENKINESRRMNIQVAVEAVSHILNHFYQKEVSGEMTRAIAQASAAKAVSELKYLGAEYFWIHDESLHMIMHPVKPELNGKDIAGMKDPEGKLFFKEMNMVVADQGSGFVRYMWPRPGASVPVAKVSYVKGFKEWKWILGSGVYIDDVQMEIAETKKNSFIWQIFGASLAVLISIFVGIRLLFKLVIPVQQTMESLASETIQLGRTAMTLEKSANLLKSSSESQSAAIHETSAAMTEMNEMISKTASSAVTSLNLANETQSSSHKGLRSIEELSESVRKIITLQGSFQKELNLGLSQMDEIVDVMNQVSSKTEVINEIVMQTRLLSFNASVEAARAGEAGKGFSVVADEIGKLALMSGASALEISTIVMESKARVFQITESIKKNLGENIEQVNDSVQSGVQKAELSLRVLEEVVQFSEKTSEMSSSITEASREQAIGIEQAAQALREIDQANQDLNRVVETADGISKEIILLSDRLENVTQVLSRVVGS